MKRTELLTAAGSLSEMVRYMEAGADGIQIGEQQFGMRLPGDILSGELDQAVRLAHEAGAKAYVAANRIMDNAALPLLPGYLEKAARAGADAVIFGDPAVLAAAGEAGLSGLVFHWNPEMTATNYATANYWRGKGAVRAILARELSMEQVLEFKRSCQAEIQVQVHGMTNIFHSRRRMVSSYLDHLQTKEGKEPQPEASRRDLAADKGMYLIEEERQDERYPVYEDQAGTHIMSGDDLCMLDTLHEFLEAEIDSLKVESLLKSQEYNITVLRAYRAAMDAYYANPQEYRFRQEWLETIEEIQQRDRPLSYGFYFKEQVY
ncbi:MAG: peptidase [Paenibacillaceae bacterium]|nr:peptidase [Paenibacillaceae bacterium]